MAKYLLQPLVAIWTSLLSFVRQLTLLKVVLKVPSMIDHESRSDAMQAILDIKGLNHLYLTTDIKNQTITVKSNIKDVHVVANTLKKKFDKVDIISDGRWFQFIRNMF